LKSISTFVLSNFKCDLTLPSIAGFFFQFDVLFYVIYVMKASTLWWIFVQHLVELVHAIIPDFSNVLTRTGYLQLFYTSFNLSHWSYLAGKFKINFTNRFNLHHPFLPSCIRNLASSTLFTQLKLQFVHLIMNKECCLHLLWTNEHGYFCNLRYHLHKMLILVCWQGELITRNSGTLVSMVT